MVLGTTRTTRLTRPCRQRTSASEPVRARAGTRNEGGEPAILLTAELEGVVPWESRGSAGGKRRPKPNSPVFLLSAEESAEVLNIKGDLRRIMGDDA